MKRLALGLSAGLFGASGLGLETLLVSCAGLSLGYGPSASVGLSTFLAGWAVGAYLAGRSRSSPVRALLFIGLLLAGLSLPLTRIVLFAGGSAPTGVLASIATVSVIATLALLQGTSLPWLARVAERASSTDTSSTAGLIACNLLGSLAGAYLLGDGCAARWGRASAAGLAGMCALLGALLVLLVGRGRSPSPPRSPAANVGAGMFAISWGVAACIVGLSTGWLAGLEWIGLRLGVLWLGGMQPALRSVVCASLLALALGAALLPRLLPRGPRGLALLLVLCTCGSIWPILAVHGLRACAAAWSAFEPRSSEIAWRSTLERVPELVRAGVITGPSLLAFGAIVPVLHRELSGESGERLGKLYLHEAWGAVVFVPLTHLVLVPCLGLGGACALLVLLGGLSFVLLMRVALRLSVLGTAASIAVCVWAALQPEPALDSPPFSNPALRLCAFDEDRDFAVAVVDDGLLGERTLLTDGFRAAGTGQDYRYMRVLGHLPVLLHPAPRCVAVLALGTGTTLGAVALHAEVQHIDVLEISRAVVADAPWFETKNHGVLSQDPRAIMGTDEPVKRVVVRLGDGRRTLSDRTAAYDVITMEPLLPDSPFAVYLYTPEFYRRARGALNPGGLVCQWVPPHALEPATFAAVIDAFARSFAWSSVWLFGTQVILVGGARTPDLRAERFASADGDLAQDLVELGIDTPRGLVARFVGDGAGCERDGRALTDEDPWVIYRPRRRGAVLLGDLPANFAALREIDSDPPVAWSVATGRGAGEWRAGIRSLHAARETQAWIEARLRGFDPGLAGDRPDESDLERHLARAREMCPGDPELQQFEEELAFLRNLRTGVSLLAIDTSLESARAALPHLLSAAEARRERADVHLYMAVALERLGSPQARQPLEETLERCPGIARTAEGARARQLGLSDASWRRLEESARR